MIQARPSGQVAVSECRKEQPRFGNLGLINRLAEVVAGAAQILCFDLSLDLIQQSATRENPAYEFTRQHHVARRPSGCGKPVRHAPFPIRPCAGVSRQPPWHDVEMLYLVVEGGKLRLQAPFIIVLELACVIADKLGYSLDKIPLQVLSS